MIIFDTLDNIELYLKISDKFIHVITVMDRSLPYDQGVGKYKCPECEEVAYEISAYPTTDKGRVEIPSEKEFSLEIVLEGEAVTSINGNVFVMSPGRFLLSSNEKDIKRGITRNIDKSVKSVIFRF